jgi:pimeloyl-ACP methyl ester carboxylesterase
VPARGRIEGKVGGGGAAGLTRRQAQRRMAAHALASQQEISDQLVRRGDHRVLDMGEGDESVVFIPTFGELAFVYADLIRTMSANYRVLTFNPRVSARSPFGPRERAEEALKVMAEAGVADAHLVAWSDAGGVLTEMAAMAPDRVKSSTYIGTPGTYRLPRPLAAIAPLYVRYPLNDITVDAVAALVVAWFLGGKNLATRDLLRHVRDLGPVADYLRFSILPCLMYSSTDRVRSCPALSGSSMPVLVIGGQADRLVSPAEQEELAAAFNGNFITIRDGDHFMPFTAEAVVTRAVMQFINSVTTSTPSRAS